MGVDFQHCDRAALEVRRGHFHVIQPFCPTRYYAGSVAVECREALQFSSALLPLYEYGFQRLDLKPRMRMSWTALQRIFQLELPAPTLVTPTANASPKPTNNTATATRSFAVTGSPCRLGGTRRLNLPRDAEA
jgi:hypothetical protein